MYNASLYRFDFNLKVVKLSLLIIPKSSEVSGFNVLFLFVSATNMSTVFLLYELKILLPTNKKLHIMSEAIFASILHSFRLPIPLLFIAIIPSE